MVAESVLVKHQLLILDTRSRRDLWTKAVGKFRTWRRAGPTDCHRALRT